MFVWMARACLFALLEMIKQRALNGDKHNARKGSAGDSENPQEWLRFMGMNLCARGMLWRNPIIFVRSGPAGAAPHRLVNGGTGYGKEKSVILAVVLEDEGNFGKKFKLFLC